MRLRHRRPHSGPARHLNPPFGAKRRHGGRLHIRAEGSEAKARADRPRKRQSGGSTGASNMTPAQQAAMNMAANSAGQNMQGYSPINPASQAALSQEMSQQALGGSGTGQKRGGAVAKRRAKGGRARHKASAGAPTFGGPKTLPQPQAAPPQALPQASDDDDEDEGLKSGGGKWIQKAIKHPGGLHRALHVPQGEKIPAKKLAKASHSENPRIRKMVGLAKTLKKMH